MKLLSTRILTGAIALATAAGLGACKKDPPAGTPGAQQAPVQAANAPALDDLSAFLRDESKAMTADILEKLVLACKDCPIAEWDVDGKCEAYKAYQKARGRKTAVADVAGLYSGVGAKHLENPSAAVRLISAKLMSSFFGANAQTKGVIAVAARKEKDEKVLRAMLRAVGASVKDVEIRKLILEMSEHGSEKVRQEALLWLSSSFAKGDKEAADKVLMHLEKDGAMNIRKALCRDLHKTGDARAFDTYKKYLETADTPKDLFADCWNGLISSWTGFPLPENPDRRAYDLTLKLLNKTPRTEDRPPWSGISSLRAAKSEVENNNPFQKKWLEKVSGWYKKDALMGALKAVVGDSAAHWMARTGAVQVLAELKVDGAFIDGLAKKYGDAKGNDKFVGDAAKRILERAKKPAK